MSRGGKRIKPKWLKRICLINTGVCDNPVTPCDCGSQRWSRTVASKSDFVFSLWFFGSAEEVSLQKTCDKQLREAYECKSESQLSSHLMF